MNNKVLCFVLIWCILCSIAALAQLSVEPVQTGYMQYTGTGGFRSYTQYAIEVCSYNDGATSNPKRGFLFFDAQAIPDEFSACSLDMTTHFGEVAEIDISLVPADEATLNRALFDFDFQQPFVYAGRFTLSEYPGPVSIDLTEAVLEAKALGSPFVVVRLSARIGGPSVNIGIYGVNQSVHPRPAIVFLEPVADESSGMGAIKAMYR